jgi:hypothetical protein
MRVRGNCEHAAPTWTGTKPSPTPLPRPPKPSTSSNPGLSHEQVAPVDTCQERPFDSTPSSCRRVLSANRTLTRRARPPTGADQVQTAVCSSADSATATRRRGRIDRHRYRGTHRPVGIRRPSCPLAATNICPNACRIGEPNSPRAVPLKPHLGWAGPNRAGAAITLLRRDSSGSRPCG